VGWKRIKGHEYYYESRWEAGRSVSVYRGAGRLAVLCAALDGAERREKAERRDAERLWREELKSGEREADEVDALAEAVFRAVSSGS
jgi:hypothetical protein